MITTICLFKDKNHRRLSRYLKRAWIQSPLRMNQFNSVTSAAKLGYSHQNARFGPLMKLEIRDRKG